MKPSFFLQLLLLAMVPVLFTRCVHLQATEQNASSRQEVYQCLPCGYDCDTVGFSSLGECPRCQMPLVKKSSIRFKTIAPSAVCAYIRRHPGVVLLDVRTKDEYEGQAKPDFGTLKNAINIPIQELESRLSEISHLKTKEIIVYCSHSHRSPQASYELTQRGFANVTNMAGGMSVMSDKTCKK